MGSVSEKEAQKFIKICSLSWLYLEPADQQEVLNSLMSLISREQLSDETITLLAHHLKLKVNSESSSLEAKELALDVITALAQRKNVSQETVENLFAVFLKVFNKASISSDLKTLIVEDLIKLLESRPGDTANALSTVIEKEDLPLLLRQKALRALITHMYVSNDTSIISILGKIIIKKTLSLEIKQEALKGLIAWGLREGISEETFYQFLEELVKIVNATELNSKEIHEVGQAILKLCNERSLARKSVHAEIKRVSFETLKALSQKEGLQGCVAKKLLESFSKIFLGFSASELKSDALEAFIALFNRNLVSAEDAKTGIEKLVAVVINSPIEPLKERALEVLISVLHNESTGEALKETICMSFQEIVASNLSIVFRKKALENRVEFSRRIADSAKINEYVSFLMASLEKESNEEMRQKLLDELFNFSAAVQIGDEKMASIVDTFILKVISQDLSVKLRSFYLKGLIKLAEERQIPSNSFNVLTKQLLKIAQSGLREHEDLILDAFVSWPQNRSCSPADLLNIYPS